MESSLGLPGTLGWRCLGLAALGVPLLGPELGAHQRCALLDNLLVVQARDAIGRLEGQIALCLVVTLLHAPGHAEEMVCGILPQACDPRPRRRRWRVRIGNPQTTRTCKNELVDHIRSRVGEEGVNNDQVGRNFLLQWKCADALRDWWEEDRIRNDVCLCRHSALR